MRTPLLGDVVAAARALRAAVPDERLALLDVLLKEATLAGLHRRETGRCHPHHGDGSLMAASLSHPCAREPSLEDRDYCLCLAAVLLRLALGGHAPASIR